MYKSEYMDVVIIQHECIYNFCCISFHSKRNAINDKRLTIISAVWAVSKCTSYWTDIL